MSREVDFPLEVERYGSYGDDETRVQDARGGTVATCPSKDLAHMFCAAASAAHFQSQATVLSKRLTVE